MSPVTTYETLLETIRKRIHDNITGYPIAWDNVSFEPSGAATWLRATVELGESVQVELGATSTYRRPGNVVFQIFTQPDTGDEEWTQIADMIQEFFRGQSEDGITWRTPTINKVGERQGWWQVNVTCPFYSDVIV